MNYILAVLAGYLIGSIPTAFLVVKKTSQLDIRNAGSGNVGGRNAYEVTGKKRVGLFVTLFDIGKGICAVLAAQYFFPGDPDAIVIAMGSVVFGHCYSVWIEFHGGRGLATAAGTLLVVGWIFVVVWLALYFGFQKITKNVHAASSIALVFTPVAAWFLPKNFVESIITESLSVEQFFAAGSLVCAICLSKHIQPLKELGKSEA